MTTPIADEVLRKFLDSGCELVHLPGYGTVSTSDMGAFGHDLAESLLAARAALRECLGYVEEYACGKPHPVVDKVKALLPPAPAGEA